MLSYKITLLLTLVSLIFIQSCQSDECQSGWTPNILEKSKAGDLYLPDYSYAGYMWGEEDIPNDEGTIIDVTDYGVVADDKNDDTQGLKKAFQKANTVNGLVTVKLPKGKIILTEILYIEKSDFILKGAGCSKENGTVLYMPKSLNELQTPPYLDELKEYLVVNDKRQIEKERGIDEPFSLYAWSGGFIWVNFPKERGKPYLAKYNPKQEQLGEIIEGNRGDHKFVVKTPNKLKIGEIVRINWYNKEGENSSLIKYLYDYQNVDVGIRHWESPEIPLTKQEVTITGIEDNTVFIKEPLLHDLKTEWYPDITKWNYIRGVGIEDIYFEFLYQEYKYHHVEYGFNGIYFTNTTHSWVRNVTFRNGDNGVLTDLCSNISFDNISVYGRKYHYGVHFGDCYNMLASNLYLEAPIVHSLTFNTGSRSCVYTKCNVLRDPTLDQHSGLNYQNLFDNIQILIDDPEHNPLTMGGAKYWAPSHAAFSTFWNIQIDFKYDNYGQDTIKIKGVTDSPSGRLVGLYGNYPIKINYPINTYEEGTNNKNIMVPSLYKYQLNTRLSKN